MEPGKGMGEGDRKGMGIGMGKGDGGGSGNGDGKQVGTRELEKNLFSATQVMNLELIHIYF